MQSNSKDLTNAENLKVKMLAIKDEVTTADRKAYIEISNCTPATVSNYLNGRISDTDTALYMLLFFKNRIQAKKNVLANL